MPTHWLSAHHGQFHLIPLPERVPRTLQAGAQDAHILGTHDRRLPGWVAAAGGHGGWGSSEHTWRPLAPVPSPPQSPLPTLLPRGLPTDRYMWSDATGLHECTKATTKPPSPHWTWVSPQPRPPWPTSAGLGPHSPLLPRSRTGPWTSASQVALTKRGGSMPATSLRESRSLPWPFTPAKPGGLEGRGQDPVGGGWCLP